MSALHSKHDDRGVTGSVVCCTMPCAINGPPSVRRLSAHCFQRLPELQGAAASGALRFAHGGLCGTTSHKMPGACLAGLYEKVKMMHVDSFR